MNNFYVYALLNPIKNNKPYYIGKGKNGRINAHFTESSLKNCQNSHKISKIKNIREKGYIPRKYTNILQKNLSEQQALKFETFVIETIGLENLTNQMKTDKAKSGKLNPFYGESHTKKTKQKMSAIKMGENHPFWNESLSENHKENISKEVESYNRIKEHNRNISKGLKGRTLSESQKKSISESLKGRTFSEETKKKLSESNRQTHLGKTLSESHKESLSESFTGEKNPECKLTKEEAREIKWLSQNTNKTNKRVAKMYSVSAPTVSAIKNERSWNHIEPKKIK